MTIIYIVTAGEYSDYGILGVFSTKELAEEYAAKVVRAGDYFTSNSQIEEWPLDEKQHDQLKTMFCCSIETETGVIEREWTLERLLAPDAMLNDGPITNTKYQGGYSVESAEHARKIAIERRQAALRLAAQGR